FFCASLLATLTPEPSTLSLHDALPIYPMPLWLTVAIGLTGSIVGAVVGRALFHDNGFVISFGSLGVAIALVLAYRRFIQRRPLWGPDALRFPQRGVGIAGYRERLRKVGIDPDQPQLA